MRHFAGNILLMLALTALLSGCGDDGGGPTDPADHYEATADVAFVYPVHDQTRLELSAVAGSIEIVGESGSDSVYIEAQRKIVSQVSQDDADNRLDLLQVFALSYDNRFDIETDQPAASADRQYYVDYSIHIPDHLSLVVSQVSGTIYIGGIDASITTSNVTGNMTLDRNFGDLTASVVTGSVSAECGIGAGGSLSISTVTGSIQLSVPSSTSARFQASAANGEILLSGLQLGDVTVGEYSLSGTLGDGDGEIALSTVTGNIAVFTFVPVDVS